MGMVFGNSPSAVRLCADDEGKFSTKQRKWGRRMRKRGENKE
jgi:hypothetical protein